MGKFQNAFDAISESKAESITLTLRSQLMMKLDETISNWGLSQRKVA